MTIDESTARDDLLMMLNIAIAVTYEAACAQGSDPFRYVETLVDYRRQVLGAIDAPDDTVTSSAD